MFSAILITGFPYPKRQAVTAGTPTVFRFSNRVWSKRGGKKTLFFLSYHFPPVHKNSWISQSQRWCPRGAWRVLGVGNRWVNTSQSSSVQPSRDTSPQTPSRSQTGHPGGCCRQQNLFYSRSRLTDGPSCTDRLDLSPRSDFMDIKQGKTGQTVKQLQKRTPNQLLIFSKMKHLWISFQVNTPPSLTSHAPQQPLKKKKKCNHALTFNCTSLSK